MACTTLVARRPAHWLSGGWGIPAESADSQTLTKMEPTEMGQNSTSLFGIPTTREGTIMSSAS
eukprot:9000205-Pyramimonas_sp.AAC.1